MTKLWALKQLYIALGGKFADVRLIETNAEMIKIIADWVKAHGGGGGGGRITVDDFLSLISENPVQNKIITAALNEKLSAEDAENIISANEATIVDIAQAITGLIDLD